MGFSFVVRMSAKTVTWVFVSMFLVKNVYIDHGLSLISKNVCEDVIILR